MNPRHRDRVAFVRVCSGRLAKDMLGRQRPAEHRAAPVARLSLLRPRSRDRARKRFPATSSASSTPGRIAIGDTLYAGKPLEYPRIPQFPSEQFAILRPGEMRHKRFDEAVLQLAEEGLLQVFMPIHGTRNPIVGVIGSLQLDVIEARMASEYGIPCTVDRLPHVAARWPVVEKGGRRCRCRRRE